MAHREPGTSSDSSATLLRGGLSFTGRDRRIRAGAGFTIVELLVVIVVIGILASIVIVAYNGLTGRARDVSLKSDLQNAASQLELDNAKNGGYPSTGNQANGGQGLPASTGNTLAYAIKPYGYCVSASNPADPNVFALRSNSGQIQSGTCDTIVSTLAGSSQGFADGTGSAAQFSTPRSIAVDSAGNTYVADQGNNRIRKISPSGVVTTLAGSGTAGYADGTGAAAQFNWPFGVAVDGSGTVYVADSSNNRIRKISSSGVVTTLAGSTNGYADGTGAAAQFNQPYGVAVDANGNVYVADTFNCLLRKITPAGVVTTLAGSYRGYADGTGTGAAFDLFNSVAVGSDGTIYVSDSNNNRIRKVTPTGVVTTLAGSGAGGSVDGTGTAAQFNNPNGIALDSSGTVYVAENGQRIRSITSTGVVTTLAGTGTGGYVDGLATSAQFYFPGGVTVDGSGNLYVADIYNYRVRKISQ